MSRSGWPESETLTHRLFSTLESSVMQVSEQGLRKVLYQKMLACFPSGWMTTGQISRDGECLLLIRS